MKSVFVACVSVLGLLLSSCVQSDMEALAKLSMGKPLDYVERALGAPVNERYAEGALVASWWREYDEVETKQEPGHWDKVYNHHKKKYEDVYHEGAYYDEYTRREMSVQAKFMKGQMCFMQYDTNINSPTYSVWKNANCGLIDWLDANTFGDVEDLREIYAENPYLNTEYYHLLGAAEAAQNNRVEAVLYYVNEKGVSLDKPVSAWVSAGYVSGSQGTFYAARKTVREYAYDAGAQKVIQAIGMGKR